MACAGEAEHHPRAGRRLRAGRRPPVVRWPRSLEIEPPGLHLVAAGSGRPAADRLRALEHRAATVAATAWPCAPTSTATATCGASGCPVTRPVGSATVAASWSLDGAAELVQVATAGPPAPTATCRGRPREDDPRLRARAAGPGRTQHHRPPRPSAAGRRAGRPQDGHVGSGRPTRSRPVQLRLATRGRRAVGGAPTRAWSRWSRCSRSRPLAVGCAGTASHPGAGRPTSAIVLAWARLGSLADALAVGPIAAAPTSSPWRTSWPGRWPPLHAAGFVHGDISPGNVLRADERTVVAGRSGRGRPGRRRARPCPDGAPTASSRPRCSTGRRSTRPADVFALGSVIAAAIGAAVHRRRSRPMSLGPRPRPPGDERRPGRPARRPPSSSGPSTRLAMPPIDHRHPSPASPRSPAGHRRRDRASFATPPVRRLVGPNPNHRRRRRPSVRRVGHRRGRRHRSSSRPCSWALAGRPAAIGRAGPRRSAQPGRRRRRTRHGRSRIPTPCPGSSAATPGRVRSPYRATSTGSAARSRSSGGPTGPKPTDPTPSGARHRFAMGRPGDQLLLGDWDGDGRDTPALYDPSAGTVDPLRRMGPTGRVALGRGGHRRRAARRPRPGPTALGPRRRSRSSIRPAEHPRCRIDSVERYSTSQRSRSSKVSRRTTRRASPSRTNTTAGRRTLL